MSPEAFKHYKTNIKEIDEQHLNILNKAKEIVRNEDLTPEQLNTEIELLDSIFVSHLKYEEELMRKINYKYLNSHMEAHKTLKSEFDKIVDDLKKIPRCKLRIINKLDHILIDHVDHYDLQYIQYYIEYSKAVTVE